MTDGQEDLRASRTSPDDWETECPKSDDKQHCNCWYDGKPCCRCGVAMDFGDALKALKDPGAPEDTHIGRSGWNGKGMWLGLQRPDANSKMGMPYIYLKTVQGALVPWNPNNIDMLAEDWEIYD